jgi:hypothetical protein
MLASALLFLASDDSGFVTSKALRIPSRMAASSIPILASSRFEVNRSRPYIRL